MNKNIPVIGGGILVVVIIGYLTLFNSDPDRSDYDKIPPTQKSALIQDEPNDIAITYENKKTDSASHAVGGSTPGHNKSLKIEASAGKYRVSIVDKENIRYPSKGYVTVSGTIDKESFKLHIPKAMVENYHEGIELQVYNASTQTTQSTPASFISSMTSDPGTLHDSIDIDPDNVSNINHEQKNSILPTP